MKKKLFRTLFVSTLLTSATLFSACDEEAGLVINFPQTFESIYRVDPFSGTIISKVDTVSFNLDSVLTANNAEREDIESVEFSGLSVAITDSTGAPITGQNFTNFRNLEASISELNGTFTTMATIDSTNIAPLASNNPLVFPGTAIVPVNLLPFISAPSFRIQLNSRIGNSITSRMYIKSIVTVTINAKI